MTVGVVWTACFLYLGVLFQTEKHSNARQPKAEAQRDLGASGTLTQFHKITTSSGKVESIPRATGPIDLWEGELWRIPVNAFHHADLLHLLMNGIALLFMGKIIEPRLGKWRTLLFYLIAATISILSETLIGNSAIGLSGVAYAQVGLLMVWRDRDPEVAAEFPFFLVILAGLWLVGCQIATYANIAHIANLGHYSGIIYGWFFGQAYLAASKSPLPRFLFMVGHLFLIPALWFAMNPFWSGHWHWYRASLPTGPPRHLTRAEESDNWLRGPFITPVQRFERLQAAVLYDRSLAGAWNELTAEFIATGDTPGAFRVALEGLRHNPGDSDLLEKVVVIWADSRLKFLPLDAERLVANAFEDDAERWTRKLRSRVDPYVNRLSWTQEELERLVGFVPRVQSASTEESPPSLSAPDTDPNAPNSALGGMTM